MNMESFVYEALPTRVVFGSGTIARIREEVERLGARRALVLSTPGRGEDLANEVSLLLRDLSAGVHAGAVMHTPIDATEKALSVVRERAADALVAVGGGSTTGLGKALALRTDLPQVVVPTTYAGSEMPPILGETKDGVKTTQRTLKVLPEVVIYDVDLTLVAVRPRRVRTAAFGSPDCIGPGRVSTAGHRRRLCASAPRLAGDQRRSSSRSRIGAPAASRRMRASRTMMTVRSGGLMPRNVTQSNARLSWRGAGAGAGPVFWLSISLLLDDDRVVRGASPISALAEESM